MSGHVFSRADSNWHKQPNQTLALYAAGHRTPLLHIAPDRKYPNLWRIHALNGRVSDLANLSRAKDAGMACALSVLNQKADMSAPRSPPMRQIEKAGT